MHIYMYVYVMKVGKTRVASAGTRTDAGVANLTHPGTGRGALAMISYTLSDCSPYSARHDARREKR